MPRGKSKFADFHFFYGSWELRFNKKNQDLTKVKDLNLPQNGQILAQAKISV